MVAQNKNPFRQWIRLEQPRLGTKVVYATDDFFADKSRLIDPAEPVFIADKFDDTFQLLSALEIVNNLNWMLEEIKKNFKIG